MAITITSISAPQERSGEASTIVQLPPTVNAGDLLVLIGAITNATPPTNPSGWDQQVSASGQMSGSPNLPGLLVSTKWATGTEGGGTVTVSHLNNHSAWITLSLAGVDSTTPIDVPPHIANPDAAVDTLPLSLSGISSGAMLLYAAGISGQSATATPPSGFTEILDRTSGLRPATAGYRLDAAPGSTGTLNLVWSGTGRNVGTLIAFRPIPGPVITEWYIATDAGLVPAQMGIL